MKTKKEMRKKRKMRKKLIIFNLLLCIIVIFVNYNFFNSKSRNAIAYSYAENYIETNYGIARENLKSEEIDYMRGMGHKSYYRKIGKFIQQVLKHMVLIQMQSRQ